MTITNNKILVTALLIIIVVISGIWCLQKPAEPIKAASSSVEQKEAYIDPITDDSIEEAYCPIEKMSHTLQIDCMQNILKQKESMANTLYATTSAQAVSLGRVDGQSSDVELLGKSMMYNNLARSLPDLNASWKPYRNALCQTETSDVTGNGQGDAYITCQVQETDRYISLLQKIQLQWLK